MILAIIEGDPVDSSRWRNNLRVDLELQDPHVSAHSERNHHEN